MEIFYVCSVAQSCLTLYDPMDGSPTVSTLHGIFQARILEQIAISYSRQSSPPRNQTRISCFSCIARRFFTTVPIGKPGSTLHYFFNADELVSLCLVFLFFFLKELKKKRIIKKCLKNSSGTGTMMCYTTL